MATRKNVCSSNNHITDNAEIFPKEHLDFVFVELLDPADVV